MNKSNFLKIILVLLSLLILNSCANHKWGDARTTPAQGNERAAKNIEEGKGFRLMDINKSKNSGTFDFASSNELWRAALDTIEFMPLVSANYSGGIIISDWYNDGGKSNESIKISIRFLSNEVRSDALDIKIFYKRCEINNICKVIESVSKLKNELKKSILKKAAIYKKQNENKKKKPYKSSIPKKEKYKK